MTLAHVIAGYLSLNMMAAAGFACLAIYSISAGFMRRPPSAGTLLKLHYVTLSLLIPFLLLHPFLPERGTVTPALQVWSAKSMDTRLQEDSSHDGGYLEFHGGRASDSFGTDHAGAAVYGLGIGLLFFGGLAFIRDLRKLFLLRRGSHLIRKLGSVSIHANDHITVPFSWWLPGMADIFVPTDLTGKWPDYKIALFHELQHHRNGDTKWIYFLWFLKLVCILNPFVHLWRRSISALQEFACDEVLVVRKGIDSREYARCLYETARSSAGCRCKPVYATGLMLTAHRALLKRRIELILGKIANRYRRRINLGAGIAILVLMASISFASRGVVQDRRITGAQAAAMAESAVKDSNYPIVVNDLVLKELNAYLGTPEGREFIGSSLARMERYRKDIEKKIEEYGVPMEFLAIPLVESGYRNLEQQETWGAGIWMFIQSTARAFGLTVNDKVDERLSVDILTDAAMRYLLANKLRFNDWQLSVLAYNVGASTVQKAIERTGSREVWALSREHYKDSNYYAKFMAAVIILKNPDVVVHKSELP